MKYFFGLMLILLVQDWSQPDPIEWNFDQQLEDYFTNSVEQYADHTKSRLNGFENWDSFRLASQHELQDMLGLVPWPDRGDLQSVVTGRIEHKEFIVEKIHFQSISGLYVTGNLYIPKNLTGPAPTILYVCGHATIEKNGYNYGSKSHYQHHPAWFARHGYVCLILDTHQLAEIEGIHHGTYRYDRWWWLSRGYVPSGVETWNGIRAIDFLCTRSEVDTSRIGVSGRSGGGAISWYLAALDDRIKVAVPVAGITDLEDHILNNCVEGHCDCMYPINHHQWDFGHLAAMIAPRPLLICNTDRDPIFPLNGVFRTYQQARVVYDLLGAEEKLGFQITAGKHQDVQELRVHAFRWFNKHLQGHERLIESPAIKYFKPEELRVFEDLPTAEINTTIDQVFTTQAPSASELLSQKPWAACKNAWYTDLRQKVFNNWPNYSPSLETAQKLSRGDIEFKMLKINTDGFTKLPIFQIRKGPANHSKKVHIVLLDGDNTADWLNKLAALAPQNFFVNKWTSASADLTALESELEKCSEIFLVPFRGSGLAAFSGDDKVQNHIRRRYPLLGQSLEMMQTWDILQAISQISQLKKDIECEIELEATGLSASMLIYAANFFEKELTLNLNQISSGHHSGPHYPGILRDLDIDAALLLASEKHTVILRDCPVEIKKELSACYKLNPTLKQPQIL